jgi:hypothetical protein
MLTQALVEAGAPEGQGFIEPVSDAVGGAVAYRVHDLWHHAPDYVSNRRARETERRLEKGCLRCGVVFHAADPRSQYCSAACRQGGWRDRQSGRNGVLPIRDVTETDRNTPPAPAPTRARTPKRKNESAELELAPPQEPSEVREDTDAQGPSEARRRVFLSFPVVGSAVPTWVLVEGQVEDWRVLFPGLDVHGEARKALAWLQASPGRRKTARGMPRFLVGWLSRVVDRGGGQRGQAPRQDGVRSGSTCPHDPQCATRHACIDRIVGEARAAKSRAS